MVHHAHVPREDPRAEDAVLSLAAAAIHRLITRPGHAGEPQTIEFKHGQVRGLVA